MKTDLLTVTFPVFERFDFFEEALDSVLNQTIKCQVLVIDNCSSHSRFLDACRKRNVKYIRNKKNIGLFPNWNKCLSNINTKYGMIFQDDNIMKPNFVEEFVNTIHAYPELDFYFTDFDLIDLKTKKISSHNHVFPFGFMDKGNKIIEYGIKKDLGMPYAFIIKLNLFTEYYHKCHGSNDWLWVYDNIYRFSVFGNNRKLFSYGQHPNQDSRNPVTKMQTSLSISYIFKITSEHTNKIDLKKLAMKKSKDWFYYFLSISPGTYLNDVMLNDDIYASHLKNNLNNNILLLMYLRLPVFLKKYSYKIARKLYRMFTKF